MGGNQLQQAALMQQSSVMVGAELCEQGWASQRQAYAFFSFFLSIFFFKTLFASAGVLEDKFSFLILTLLKDHIPVLPSGLNRRSSSTITGKPQCLPALSGQPGDTMSPSLPQM